MTRDEFTKLYEEMRQRLPRKPAKPADGEKKPQD
jgi:hypothetical protein